MTARGGSRIAGGRAVRAFDTVTNVEIAIDDVTGSDIIVSRGHVTEHSVTPGVFMTKRIAWETV